MPLQHQLVYLVDLTSQAQQHQLREHREHQEHREHREHQEHREHREHREHLLVSQTSSLVVAAQARPHLDQQAQVEHQLMQQQQH